MRRIPLPNPVVVAAVFGSVALAGAFLVGPIQFPGPWLPDGIVAWATVSMLNPLEDYVWFAASLLVGAGTGGLVLAAYWRRGRLAGDARSSSLITTVAAPPIDKRFVVAATAVAIVLWILHTSAFDITTPIANTITLQPANPAGMRFDPFHDGERLGFGPAFARLGDPFARTFFIHGFGIDALPDVLAERLLPGLDRILAMRVFLILQLIITSIASVWAAAEVLLSRTPRTPKVLTAVALLTYLLLSRMVYPFLLLSIIDLALVVRLARIAGKTSRRATAVHASAISILVPLGLLYSYSGLVVSVVVIAAGVIFVPPLRSRQGVAGLLVGAIAGAMAVVVALGLPQSVDVISQVAYWIRWGGPMWDRPPTTWFGPNDVLVPALLFAMAVQVSLILWIVSRRIGTTWRAWLAETGVAWILLAFAVVGSRDAIDRAGFDYGERAFATSAFGLMYLIGGPVSAFVAGLPRRVGMTAITGAGVLLAAQVGQSLIAAVPAKAPPIPSEFTEAKAAVGVSLPSDACIYTLTSEGLWYFVLDRPACSKFHQIQYGRGTDVQEGIVADLALRVPPVLIFTDSSAYGQTDFLSVASTNAKVVRWVIERYRPATLASTAWIWSPGQGPHFPATADVTRSAAEPVQQGSEIEVLGAGIVDGHTGDALYVTVDGSANAVTAAPLLPRCGRTGFRLWIPTFDLSPGDHVARLWIVRAGTTEVQPFGELDVPVLARMSPIDFHELFRAGVGAEPVAALECAG